jgi:hypothetical protein
MSARESFTTDEAQHAGEQIGIDWPRAPFDVEQFRKGMDVELEHGLRDSATNVTGDDTISTAKIALAHLNEFSDYYTRLLLMEQEAEHGNVASGTSTALAEQFLPVFDISDQVALVVNADSAACWEALLEADLIEVGRSRPLVALLGALRALPEVASHLLHGERPAALPARLTLHDAAQLPAAAGGWILLGERPSEEIALGLVGKFWRPVIDWAQVSAEEFAAFAEPGYAKTVYALGVRALEAERTLLWALMRTGTTDEAARRWFRRYWTFGVGSGAHILVNGLLELAREKAERRPRETGDRERRTSPTAPTDRDRPHRRT